MNKLLLCCLLAMGCRFAQARQFETYTADKLMQRIQRNPDTLYIVNFWATWCGPCVKELPAFDTLARHYAGAPVKVLLVSFDFRDDYQAKLDAFIAKKKPVPEIVWFGETDANAFIPKIDGSWTGSLPATLMLHRGRRFFREDIVNIHSLTSAADSLLRTP